RLVSDWSSDVCSSDLTDDTLNFFGPLVARGTVGTAAQKADQIFIQDQVAYNTLQQLGPLSQIQVTGPGIEPGTFVTVASAPPGKIGRASCRERVEISE